jgi:queuine tRNA-ribosyltransferase
LRHLFKAQEILALQLASVHNLSFYHWLCRSAREAITESRFDLWMETQMKRLSVDVATVQ